MTPKFRIDDVMSSRAEEGIQSLANPLFGLACVHDLAVLLGRSVGELTRIARRADNYISFETRTGGKSRAVSAPRRALDDIHRAILEKLKLLGQPDYLHSGMKGRSHLTHAAGHLNAPWLCKIDLRAFFFQITTQRVRRFFLHQMQCAPEVAALLAQLCTVNGALPIGGRLSQSLAFLAAKAMFDELDRLSSGLEIHFSAYVDDLCFSGKRATPAFLWSVKQVLHKHGYRYHAARCYPPGSQRLVTGTLLTNRGMTLRPRAALRIREDMAMLAGEAPCEQKLAVLQGRLAAASSVDPAYVPLSRAVQCRLKVARSRSLGASLDASAGSAPETGELPLP